MAELWEMEGSRNSKQRSIPLHHRESNGLIAPPAGSIVYDRLRHFGSESVAHSQERTQSDSTSYPINTTNSAYRNSPSTVSRKFSASGNTSESASGYFYTGEPTTLVAPPGGTIIDDLLRRFGPGPGNRSRKRTQSGSTSTPRNTSTSDSTSHSLSASREISSSATMSTFATTSFANGQTPVSISNSEGSLEDFEEENFDSRQPILKYPIVMGATPKDCVAINPKDTAFDVITGRFGFGPTQRSYYTTVEEVTRRIAGTEKLNSSSMANNLRRAKLKNGGEIMRAKFKQHGIFMALNNRQLAHPNKVISLVEGEALNLALDFETLVEEDYPAKEIAEEIAETNKETLCLETLLNKKGFSQCMSALESVFTSVTPPMTGVMPVASENKTLNLSMEHYSCATHGIGITTSRVWVRQMAKVGEKLIDIVREDLEKTVAEMVNNPNNYY